MSDLDAKLYDRLIRSIYNSVMEEDLGNFKENCTLVLIGTNANERQKSFVSKLLECNKSLYIILVAQEQMLEKLNGDISCYSTVIRWNGRFNKNIIPKVKEVSNEKIDALVFYSTSPIDKRNINLVDLGLDLVENGVDIYSYSAQERLYKYQIPKLYIRGMAAYETINDFLEMADTI